MEGSLVPAGATLLGADIADDAVAMIGVVPTHELSGPGTGGLQASKPCDGNPGRYLAVRNSASERALSSLARGHEYEGLTPSMRQLRNRPLTVH